MIAWYRTKRSTSKEVNYNETSMWKDALKESDDEFERKRKKKSKNVKNSGKNNKKGKQKKSPNKKNKKNRAYEYSESYEEEDLIFDDDEDSESEADSYSENESGVDDYENGEEEDNYSQEDEEESDKEKPLPYQRRIKPVKIFEIERRKKKSNKQKNKSKGKKNISSQKKKDVIEESSEESEYEPEEPSIQAILGVRDVENPKDESTTTDDESLSSEYYVKFNDRSYIHCKWMSKDQIMEIEGGDYALKRFLQVSNRNPNMLTPSLSIPNLLVMDETSISSDWYEIDRIINDANEHNRVEYLVKWKSLEYSEATWEYEEDIKDKSKIEEYHARLQHSNPKRINTRWVHPSPDKYEKIKDPPQSKIGTELRDYQLEGLNWLRFCWYHNRNNILADEMGLGKTAQLVTLLNDLKVNEKISGPFLVIAPLSTLPHWKLEFERWTDLNVVVFHGSKESRKIIKDTEINFYDDNGRYQPSRVGFDVLITNYDILRLEYGTFSSIEWRYLVVDEAHKLKNYQSKIYKQVKDLTFEHTTLLTGTPIQNNMSELWSLLHFIQPEKFNDLDDFMSKYGDMKDIAQVTDVQKIIKRILLRRKKADVENDILPKEETIIQVELTRTQKKFYKAFLNDNASSLFQQLTYSGNLPSLLNLVMQLRKVCNHPFLIRGAEESIVKEMRMNNTDPNLSRKQIRKKALIESSGKMILIDKLIPKLIQDNHKMLIFSQMVKILDILETYMINKNLAYERLDGGVSENERQAAIDRFNNDPERYVFLLSTKAGGVGINLTAADTVIIYDSDWNPQNDIQAEARCHRIGQKAKVKVYRLITRGTYENEMFNRASKKLALDHVVLDGGDMNENQPMKADEVEKMLRNGAYDLFFNDDTEIDNFCAADIDQILTKRATVYKEDVVAGGGSKFATANFNAENDTLDLNADDFWSQIFVNGRANDTSRKYTDDGLLIRKCRENIKSTDMSEVRSAIAKLIASGYPKSNMNKDPNNKERNETVDDVLIVAFSLFKSSLDDEKINIITSLLRGEKPDVESSDSDDDESEEESFDIPDPVKVYGEMVYTVEEKAEQILKRCVYFYHLRRALFLAQRTDLEWPHIKPAWESPVQEYSLMLGLYKYGWSEIMSIFEDDAFDLAKAKPLKRLTIENRVERLCFKIEKQYLYDDSDGPAESNETKKIDHIYIPVDFEPMLPKEWEEVHEKMLERKSLYDNEVISIIKAIEAIGLPIKNGSKNYKKIINIASLPSDLSPNIIEAFIERLISFTNETLSKINKSESINEANKEQKVGDDDEEDTNEKENLDFTDFPDLQQYEKILTLKKLGLLQRSIKEMNIIHDFLENITESKLNAIRELSRNSKFPEWWDGNCDIGLIKAIGKYGQNLCYAWLADRDLPFWNHLPKSSLDIVDSNAKKELKMNKQQSVDKSLKDDLAIIFNKRSRMSRVLHLIQKSEKKNLSGDQNSDTSKKIKKAKKKDIIDDYEIVMEANKFIKIASFGEYNPDDAFDTGKYILNPGLIIFRKYPYYRSNSIESKWYKFEIISDNNKPLFRVTSIGEDPEFSFEDSKVTEMLKKLFAFLREKYPSETSHHENQEGGAENAEENNDNEENNVFPTKINPSRAYTIFGICHSSVAEKLNEMKEEYLKSHGTKPKKSQKAKASKESQYIFHKITMNVPIFDLEMFPQLKTKIEQKNKTHKSNSETKKEVTKTE